MARTKNTFKRKWTDDLVQQGCRHHVPIGGGQNKLDSFRQICHGRQRALKQQSKEKREQKREPLCNNDAHHVHDH